MPKLQRRKPAPKPSLADDAAGIERLLRILGHSHLRARVARDAVLVVSGPPDDPRVHLRLRPHSRDNWHADVRTHTGRWEPIPFIGPRGNMIAWINQDLPWLLAADPTPG
jgi:hypothetical protein